jgi:hypothetical protein
MKNALVRLLVMATLATSLSAFAATDNSKHSDATAAGKQQSGCADPSQEGKKQKKDKKQQDESQEEKDFDRLLMGTHG